MCKTRDQKVHKVNDNPYQVSDSLFVESISEDVNQINEVFKMESASTSSI